MLSFDAVVLLVALFAVTFLLGSIPWGVVVSRLFFHKDLRNEGSGNIGTTNAMRSMGKVGGSAVFVLDFGKGLLSGALATFTAPHVQAASAAGADVACALCLGTAVLGCVWGHIFSPWLKFKGGKGIAVAIGCLFFVFGPVGAIIELLVFAVLVLATRYVSAGSLAAAVICPFLACWFLSGQWVAIALVTLAAVTVVWAHRGNIARLRAGTERKVGAKKPQGPNGGTSTGSSNGSAA
ncbi:glycerol-3-phosphate 1-O-acyltransferase PlsY [Adlercreutzia sp. ZJ138]|uniref:glycerol-3-phosphate 1-O-acyltransferase PlsY n=1 Tax=Adlercreutzia sp. ZJ138 TaxID=2709405 RepID=UPI0013E9EAE8|nr:glycerol-3-phosphate 1-O-acyltransferase PlsY [Adlercreutzia sp. ZJ138]